MELLPSARHNAGIQVLDSSSNYKDRANREMAQSRVGATGVLGKEKSVWIAAIGKAL